MPNRIAVENAQVIAIAIGSICLGFQFGPLVGVGVFCINWALMPQVH